MKDLLNSLSQMQAIEVFFWFVLVGLAAVLAASITGCIIKAWYKFAPKSFWTTIFIVGLLPYIRSVIVIIIETFSK